MPKSGTQIRIGFRGPEDRDNFPRHGRVLGYVFYDYGSGATVAPSPTVIPPRNVAPEPTAVPSNSLRLIHPRLPAAGPPSERLPAPTCPLPIGARPQPRPSPLMKRVPRPGV